MISAQGLQKSFGERMLFSEVSFCLNRRERVGLIGLNGTGKTTLLKILTSQEVPDQGEIIFPRGYQLGYLPQRPEFSGKTILAETAQDLPKEHGVDETWQAKKILSGLGFSPADFDRKPDEFSSGFQMRICLARVMVSNPNLLLLDEPTNFLDILSIRWLGRFLKSWPGEILLVSHDRSFLDSVSTHIIGIHRGKIRKIRGTTHNYYQHIRQEEACWEKRRVNEEKKIKKEQEFINRFRAQARHAGMVQSRIKNLGKNRPRQKLEMLQSLKFSFNSAPTPARYTLNAQEISFSYKPDQKPLIDKLSLSIEKSDRIGIIGPNGKGKTTLLRLLGGTLQANSGIIREHPLCQKSFFDPTDSRNLHNDLTIEEEIARAMKSGERKRIRQICGAMLFSGDDALKKIEVLSGGERCRVILGKVLAAPTNLLLLDEPTHHLDLDASEALLAALENFPGALVLVSHNEHFLRRLAQRLVVFKNNGIQVYPGTYDDFLIGMGWETIEEKEKNKKTTSPISKKERRRIRAEFNTRKNLLLGSLQVQVTELENSIIALEAKLNNEQLELAGASGRQDKQEIIRLSRKTGKRRQQIEKLYQELEIQGGKLDELQTLLAREEDLLPL